MEKENTNSSELIHSAASIGVYLKNQEGKYLFVQEKSAWGGKWSPVTGFVDVGNKEHPEEAAVREVKEETNLDVTIQNLLGVFHYYDQKGVLHVGYAYDASIDGGTIQTQEEELDGYGFFDAAEIRHMFDEGKIRTPQFNRPSFEMAESSNRYPTTLLRSNGRHNGHGISLATASMRGYIG